MATTNFSNQRQEGKTLTDKSNIMERWREYCNEMYKNEDDNDSGRIDEGTRVDLTTVNHCKNVTQVITC